MKPLRDNQPLTADDIECLWSIARRGKMQDQLVKSRGVELEKRGLIALSQGWPTLTSVGVNLLNDISGRAVHALDGETRKTD